MVILEPIEGQADELDTIGAGMIGLFYERSVLHEWLEIEISIPIGAGRNEGETEIFMPIDVHFKKPFHPAPWIAPYIGLGPAFDVFLAPEPEIYFGGSVAIGTYIWPHRANVGIDIEFDYNILAFEGAPAHEFLFAVGPVWRF